MSIRALLTDNTKSYLNLNVNTIDADRIIVPTFNITLDLNVSNIASVDQMAGTIRLNSVPSTLVGESVTCRINYPGMETVGSSVMVCQYSLGQAINSDTQQWMPIVQTQVTGYFQVTMRNIGPGTSTATSVAFNYHIWQDQ
jgi:hypothetical protein